MDRAKSIGRTTPMTIADNTRTQSLLETLNKSVAKKESKAIPKTTSNCATSTPKAKANIGISLSVLSAKSIFKYIENPKP